MRAQVTVYPCVDIGEQEASYERLELIDMATAETQFVAEQVINCGGLGGFGLWVQRWAPNADFLYYTDAREGAPDGLVVDWVPPLYRVRLDELQIERLGQARFSPDGQWLASWTQAQIGITAADSTESTDFTLMPADLLIVQVQWLPDSSGIMYVQADAPFAASRSAVTHIDLATMEQNLLLDTAG
jgi:hypothetical protein